MKKRNDDGYVLIYVMVVIFLLAAIAIALMSTTLRVLQAQEASVQRMEDKYKAQGEIEKLVLELDASCEKLTGSDFSSNNDAIAAVWDDLIEHIASSTSSTVTKQDGLPDDSDPDNPSTYTKYSFTLDSTGDHVCVSADIAFRNDKLQFTTHEYENSAHSAWVNKGSPADEPEPPKTLFKYAINNIEFFFDSYQITSIDPTKGGES